MGLVVGVGGGFFGQDGYTLDRPLLHRGPQSLSAHREIVPSLPSNLPGLRNQKGPKLKIVNTALAFHGYVNIALTKQIQTSVEWNF